MGIGSVADFAERMEAHERSRAKSEGISECTRQEILARHELSSPAYLNGSNEKRRDIRAVAYSRKLASFNPNCELCHMKDDCGKKHREEC